MKRFISAFIFILVFLAFSFNSQTRESNSDWISTSNNNFQVSGKNIILKPNGPMQWVVLNKELSVPYEVNFTESIKPSRGSISFLWNYNLYNAAMVKRVSTGFNQAIEINRLGQITYLKDVFTRQNIPSAGGEKRKWRIKVSSKGSMVYLNDNLVIQGPRDDATASFGFQMHLTEGSEFLIENFSVTDNGKSGRAKPVIYQYPIPDGSGRVMTIFTGGNLEASQKQYLDKMASLFYYVEQSAGVRINHTDPILAVYEKFASGNNLAATPGYAGWLEVGPTMLPQLASIAHEFAHFYYCVGGSCGTGIDTSDVDMLHAAKAAVANNWMIEGFASYLGAMGLNRLNKLSDNVYNEELGNYFGHSGKIRKAGWYDGPLQDGHRIKSSHVPSGEDPVDVAFVMAYGKGYRFFYMLGAEFGHDVIQKIIQKNRKANTKNYTAEKFLKDLETVTGRSAREYFNGWIFPGKYEKYSPVDFVDKNLNGIIDFAEKEVGMPDPPRLGG